MAVPFKERYFEDFRPGEVIEFGDYLVTEEEIVHSPGATIRSPFTSTGRPQPSRSTAG